MSLGLRTYSSYIRDASTRNGLSNNRYFRPRFRRPRRRFPHYSNPRRRPSVYERDSRFRDWLRERLRERERIDRENELSDSEPDEPDKPIVPPSDLSKKLRVEDVDLHIAENTAKHHTDMYECTEDRRLEKADLVIRRGDKFLMTIHFSRAYDVDKHDITLIFTLPCQNGDYREKFAVNESKSGRRSFKKWSANIVKKGGKSITLEVFTPASAPIGEWELTVRSVVDVVDGKDLIFEYDHNEEINLICNPWCREDIVYLDDDTWRNEAILNDTGAVYYGSYRQIGASTWHYGQFDFGILHAAFSLIRRAFNYRASKSMGNAIKLCRLMSAMVNAPDDNGVLVGNWSDDFSGGVSPTEWNGSVKILRQYMRTGKPVKYAQCWVYSAVLTTVCRALGIPCRSVTNFESAHNTDQDHLSHDTVVDYSGRVIAKSDSKWNFHVWNDVWLTRTDISRQYDGWQAIDATPQERSGGVFCCGPAPLKAIKEGDINTGYDTAFVFAEVNADMVVWLKDFRGNMKVITRDESTVGKKMSTRKPNGSPLERLDVTDQYKYAEGTPKEREIVRKAERLFRFDTGDEEDIPTPEIAPLELDIEEQDDIYIGSDFTVVVVARNKNDKSLSINLNIKVLHKKYFGEIIDLAAEETYRDEAVGPREDKPFTCNVPLLSTLTYPRGGFNFEIKAVATVNGTDQVVLDSSNFRLRRPDVIIKGPTSGRAEQALDFEVSFTNPLPYAMTNVLITVDGNLKPEDESIDLRGINVGMIRRGATWRTTMKMIPTRVPRTSRERTASFGLRCDQLEGIIGTHTLRLQ